MARDFDGTNDDIVFSGIDLSAHTKVAISFWAKIPDAVAAYRTLLEFGTPAYYTSGQSGFAIYSDRTPGTTITEIYVGTSAAVYRGRSFTRPSTGVWHHWLVNLDRADDSVRSIPSVYIDGVSQTLTNISGGGANTGNFGNTELNIGSRDSASTWGKGSIADICIYPGENLSQNEATALANRCPANMFRPSCNPLFIPLLGLHSPEPGYFRTGLPQTGTVNGATWVSHAPATPASMFLFGRAPLIEAAAAGVTYPQLERFQPRGVERGVFAGF